MASARSWRLAPRCAWLLSLIVVAGCGDPAWQAEVHPASGTLSINAAPPVGVIVTFHPVGPPLDSRDSRPAGVVDQDGTYRLTTYDANDGAPAGDYAVTLTWPWDLTSGTVSDRLLGAYADPAKSQWKVKVSADQPKIPPIELVGAKVQSSRPKVIEP